MVSGGRQALHPSRRTVHPESSPDQVEAKVQDKLFLW